MSKRQPSCSLEQGCFNSFQLDIPQSHQRPPPPPRSRNEALRECIPKSEDEWQRRRRQRRFVTPDDINTWVSNLVTNRSLPKDLQRLIDIAIFCVESRKDEDKAYRNYAASAQTDCSVLTARNYASLLRGVIALMDQIYPKLRHRAFEAVLLYVPLGLASLAYYKQEPEQFKSCFHSVKIVPEEHASQALYLPFIIAYRLPEYSYNRIRKALGTSVLEEPEFLKFVSVLESRKPVPHILPAPQQPQPPTEGRYDPVRDQWVPTDAGTIQNDIDPGEDDIDLTEHLDTEKMFAIPDCVSGYKRFDLPETIQQKSATAAEEQDGCAPLEIPGVVSFKFDWATCHDAVCSMVLGLLYLSLLVSILVPCLPYVSDRHAGSLLWLNGIVAFDLASSLDGTNSDALAAEQPDFTGFDHFPLLRLRNMFSALAGDNLDRNLASLRELDVPSIVTLGLCLSTTKIKRMDKGDLEEVVHQAKEIGSRIRSIIYTSGPLAQVIQGSGNPVLIQEFNQQVGEFTSSMTGNVHVAWSEAIAYAETVPHGHKFQGLTALALNRVVTVYLPLASADCGIRLTALFSEALLATLFGYRPDIYGGELTFRA
ncbi:hypothetical protein F66182_6483 [Fusarium sp. NRRL 66182]|nr:hypothetical protein F66182_6483 [Fusarium sp. NRRL 66182]